MEPINWTADDYWREQWANREKMEHLAAAAHDALRPLLNEMERELVRAVEDEDYVSVQKIAWEYGLLSAANTSIETHLLS